MLQEGLYVSSKVRKVEEKEVEGEEDEVK